MKRFFSTVLLIAFSVSFLSADPVKKAKKKQPPSNKIEVPCPAVLNNIKDCLDTGCGKSLDPLLNKQKNVTEGDPDTAEVMTFTKFAKLPAVVNGYDGIGFPRDAIQKKGEGKMVRVVAWAIDARPQNT